MAIKRVTVSLPAEIADRLRAEAGGRSVSAYVAELISERLEDTELDALWRAYLDEVGLSADDIDAADRVLDELVAARTTGAA